MCCNIKEDYKNINLNEVPKHKKKSENKPPTKAKHKHEYCDCVFEFDNPHGNLSRETGWITTHEIMGGSYCKICGKINYSMSFDWTIPVRIGVAMIKPELSERAKQEINPETRTLPTFIIDSIWTQKYVDI